MAKFYAGIGSRETPSHILTLMTGIAEYLAIREWTLRSGGANGADSAFENGAEAKEIYLPWQGFNGNASPLFRPTPEAIKMAEKYHPAWHKLRRGARLLMARNCHQVLGLDLKTPVEMVICWTKDAAGGGGTGQAIRIARDLGIPVNDLADGITRDSWEAKIEP